MAPFPSGVIQPEQVVGDHKGPPHGRQVEHLRKLERIALALRQQLSRHEDHDAARDGGLGVDGGDVVLAGLTEKKWRERIENGLRRGGGREKKESSAPLLSLSLYLEWQGRQLLDDGGRAKRLLALKGQDRLVLRERMGGR